MEGAAPGALNRRRPLQLRSNIGRGAQSLRLPDCYTRK